MARTRNTWRVSPGYASLAIDIIVNAIQIVKGQIAANENEITDCREFLLSAKCQRWLSFFDIDYNRMISAIFE